MMKCVDDFLDSSNDDTAGNAGDDDRSGLGKGKKKKREKKSASGKMTTPPRKRASPSPKASPSLPAAEDGNVRAGTAGSPGGRRSQRSSKHSATPAAPTLTATASPTKASVSPPTSAMAANKKPKTKPESKPKKNATLAPKPKKRPEKKTKKEQQPKGQSQKKATRFSKKGRKSAGGAGGGGSKPASSSKSKRTPSEQAVEVPTVLFFPVPTTACENYPNIPGCKFGNGCINSHEPTSFTRFLHFFHTAKTSLDICVFTITNSAITSAIKAAHGRGVKVRLITDDEQMKQVGSDIEELAADGIKARHDNSPAHMYGTIPPAI